MTSLIDVIFLLLLFFMLTSTFSKFAEIELTSGGAGTALASAQPPLFLQLGPEDVALNGETLPLGEVTDAVTDPTREDVRHLIVSLRKDVTAQRLTDLLVQLHGVQNLSVTVLGDG